MRYYEVRESLLDMTPLDIEFQRVFQAYSRRRSFLNIGQAVDALRIDPRTPSDVLEGLDKFQESLINKLPLIDREASSHKDFVDPIDALVRFIVGSGFEGEFDFVANIDYLEQIDGEFVPPIKRVRIEEENKYQDLLDLVNAIPFDHSAPVTNSEPLWSEKFWI
jgi:hypothetical protein